MKKRSLIHEMEFFLLDAGCATSSKAIQGMGNCGRNDVEQETISTRGFLFR